MFNLKFKAKHQSFDYKTRFYDAEKEALKERLARYADDGKAGDIESTKHNIREGLRGNGSQASDKNFRSKMVNQSNIRLIVIIAILCFVLYTVMISDQVLSIIQGVNK